MGWCATSVFAQGPEATSIADDMPVVWRVHWTLSHPTDSGSWPIQQWKDVLGSALTLRAPERFLGIPARHWVAKGTGQWRKAWVSGERPPTGSASPYDPISLQQSRRLIQSRMVRAGFFSAAVSMDTSRFDNKVDIHIGLDPGKRARCAAVNIEAEGTGLTGEALATIERNWRAWQGEWLDLDAMDRLRTSCAQALQEQGWFGFLSDHLNADIDTTGFHATGSVQLDVYVLPRKMGTALAPHRRGTIETIRFHYVTDGTTPTEGVTKGGIEWQLPHARDTRPFEQKMFLAPGDRFHPKKLSDTRQALRSLRALESVTLDVQARPDSSVRSDWPLDVDIAVTPAPRRILRVNGALTSRQGAGGEVKLTLGDLDFRQRAEALTLDLQGGLETVAQVVGDASGNSGVGEPFLNARVLAANLQYKTDRLIPYGPLRFPKSNRPHSLLALSFRDENRQEFSRTFAQIGLVEQFVENPATGSRLEIRPVEISLTASRLDTAFVTDLESRGLDILRSSFDSRAIFASGITWWFNPPQSAGKPRFRLMLEMEGAGHLFHALDPRAPQETDIPIPRLFGSSQSTLAARYIRWVVDARLDCPLGRRSGLHGRWFTGLASSSIEGSTVPLEKQFYVGGPNSMRGWGALQLGPGAGGAADIRVRGDVRIEWNLEYRKYVGEWVQLAGFLDAGNVWMVRPEADRPNVDFKWNQFYRQLGVSAGMGVRFDFDYFLLRCDFGHPVLLPDGLSPTGSGWQIHPAVSLPF